jgi:hypothetical protein
LKAYPTVDLLGLDLNEPGEIADAVYSKEGTGDGLFDFLWKELKDVKTDDDACSASIPPCAISVRSAARSQIKSCAAPSARSHSLDSL